jgi:hypothetical protein
MRYSCSAHNINLVIKNGLPLWEKLTKTEKNELKIIDNIDESTNSAGDTESVVTDDSEYEDEIVNEEEESECGEDEQLDQDLEDSDDEDSDSDKTTNNKEIEPDSSPIDSNQQFNEVQLIAKIKNVLQKVRSIIKLSNKSNVLFSHVKKLIMDDQVFLPSLGLDMQIRWNSTYLMINNFLKYKKYVNEVTKYPQKISKIDKNMMNKLERMSFSQFDWELLELLQSVLKTFHLSTVLVSARKYSTLSISYFVQANIEFYLESESIGRHHLYQDMLKKKILKQFRKYFEDNMSQKQMENTLIAAYLDPAVFNEIVDSDLAFAQQQTLIAMKKYYEIYKLNDDQPKEQEKDKSQQAEETSEKDGMQALAAISGRRLLKKNKALSLNEELVSYSSSIKIDTNGKKLNFDTFWRNESNSYPRIAKFACYANVTTATSVPSESSFSVAGHILRKERSRLSPKNLKYTIILKDKPMVDELCKLYNI